MLLAGCLDPAGTDAAPETVVPPVSVAVLDELPDDVAASPEAAADQPDATAEAEAPPPPPDPATLACRAQGGQMQPGPTGQGRICVRPTPDSGRACTSATDCSEACLARSRTCAPFTPLMGCHDILDRDGRPLRQCIQ